MPSLIGFFFAIVFLGAAVKISFAILKLIFGVIGVVLLVTVFPVVVLPFMALFGVFNLIIIPLLIIGGLVLVIKLIF
ncbi:MAG: hypothetical protein JXQ26_08920 [Tissierellales bacterium]|nr:hypothetical protein [Tissierellales bacterium]MBN2828101.1 hypothetical protein [Tissierellales bacterium]